MDTSTLILARENIFRKFEDLFKNKAVEAHLFGSLARGGADPYSDIDIWYVFEDTDFSEIYTDRFEYYKQLGEIIHFCEPPQNAPNKGVHTALLIQTGEVITVVDIYLCPLSTAFITPESKKIFGIDLPLGVAGFNPQKVQVGETYRIDFFIGFVLNTIKKVLRKTEDPFEAVLKEYEKLYTDYGLPVKPIEVGEDNVENLERIINSIQEVSTEKQKDTLKQILNFARKMLS